jgi:nitric oxide reductase subunit C
VTDESEELQAISPTAKKWMLGGLVLCFALQTTLVYSDDASGVELEGEALAGSELWHVHGCQVCHQLYGFGGFLGPDLTNVASRYPGDQLRDQLEVVLTNGSGQMPSFELHSGDVDAFAAFFVEMNKTGRGQVRSLALADGPTPFERAASEQLDHVGAAQAKEGLVAMQSRPCLACHAPFTPSAVGAPPLAAVAEGLSAEALDERLRLGKPPKMPPPTPAFSAEERAAVGSFLVWLSENQTDVQRRTSEFAAERKITLSALPWWEYE